MNLRTLIFILALERERRQQGIPMDSSLLQGFILSHLNATVTAGKSILVLATPQLAASLDRGLVG